MPPILPSLTLVVCAEALLRRGLTDFLHRTMHFRELVACATAPKALTQLGPRSPCLIVLAAAKVHADLPRQARDLLRACPTSSLLVVVGSPEPDVTARLMSGRRCGLVTLEDGEEVLALAIQAVLCGGTYMSALASEGGLWPHSDRKRGGPAAALLRLTDREREVLELLGQQLTVKEIGVRLGISPKTVETHKLRMREKLNLPHAGDLRRTAANHAHSRLARRRKARASH